MEFTLRAILVRAEVNSVRQEVSIPGSVGLLSLESLDRKRNQEPYAHDYRIAHGGNPFVTSWRGRMLVVRA